jgi:hypothetical protein
MHRFFLPATAVSLAVFCLLAQAHDEPGLLLRHLSAPPTKEVGCGGFGTSVGFVTSPSEAARQAKKEQKLVFVLHVSGLFEDPKLT